MFFSSLVRLKEDLKKLVLMKKVTRNLADNITWTERSLYVCLCLCLYVRESAHEHTNEWHKPHSWSQKLLCRHPFMALLVFIASSLITKTQFVLQPHWAGECSHYRLQAAPTTCHLCCQTGMAKRPDLPVCLKANIVCVQRQAYTISLFRHLKVKMEATDGSFMR